MAVNEEEASQKPELSDGVIGRVDGLKTFFTGDPDTDVGGLNHADIVGPVANCKAHDGKVVFDEANDLSLLQGRYSTTDNGGALGG